MSLWVIVLDGNMSHRGYDPRGWMSMWVVIAWVVALMGSFP